MNYFSHCSERCCGIDWRLTTILPCNNHHMVDTLPPRGLEAWGCSLGFKELTEATHTSTPTKEPAACKLINLWIINAHHGWWGVWEAAWLDGLFGSRLAANQIQRKRSSGQPPCVLPWHNGRVLSSNGFLIISFALPMILEAVRGLALCSDGQSIRWLGLDLQPRGLTLWRLLFNLKRVNES